MRDAAVRARRLDDCPVYISKAIIERSRPRSRLLLSKRAPTGLTEGPGPRRPGSGPPPFSFIDHGMYIFKKGKYLVYSQHEGNRMMIFPAKRRYRH